jgi:predicted neutral ceramidase superfamily lipid hydrolase
MVKRISEKLESEKAVMSFHKLRSNELDPLDNEILERAFDATFEAIKQSDQRPDFETDEGLEAALRRELIEIARFNGVSDPETLRDIMLASMA